MNFNSQYLTYAEYKQLGGKLDEVPFNLIELMARRKVDERTLNRLKNLPNQITEVKACIFKLVEFLSENKGNITSENTDGYSVTYGDLDYDKKKCDEIIRDYLATCQLEDGTPYLYCGV